MGRIQPSAARLHVGGLIKDCRQRACMTQRELAKETHVSESLEGAYERGERIPSAGFLIDADRHTGAGGVLTTCVDLMEQEPSRDQYLEWRLLEAEALSIGGYPGPVLPGLLQSPDYVRALYRCRVPAFTEEEVDHLVSKRLERQPLLFRKPAPTMSFVVEQVALERPVGGKAVLKQALRHVLETVSSLVHVSVQVMPTCVEWHAGLGGSLNLLSSPDGRWSVYLDSEVRSRLLTKPVEVTRYAEHYGAIRAQALSPQKSLDLIERLAGE
ncbi:Scr1 family TA system antitoxin-like transcriptional regulator [Streptomyces sp. NPDC018019]|uniref:helix-turn-helix domain-containing protein n=1 Tax=Streptomyces sp. NPDC018019 TaxID=3365030 RepID=UPI0037933AB7